MPLGDHLEELRKRILWGLALPIPLTILLLIFRTPVLKLLTSPLLEALKANNLSSQLQVLAPQEYFLTVLKISTIGSIVLSTPWILYQTWKFVSPGLWQHEKRFVYLLMPLSGLLTFCGLALFYFLMLPIVLHFFISFASEFKPSPQLISNEVEIQEYNNDLYENNDIPMKLPLLEKIPDAPAPGSAWILAPKRQMQIAIANESNSIEILNIKTSNRTYLNQSFQLGSYLDFAMLLALGVSFAFQLPLVIILLGWIGVFTPEKLKNYRKHALMGCGILGMLLTPADLFSMFILMIPLYLLFELGICLLKIFPFARISQPILSEKSEPRN